VERGIASFRIVQVFVGNNVGSFREIIAYMGVNLLMLCNQFTLPYNKFNVLQVL
jgi:hypothetical protein